jgi:hypothetical protein
MITEIKSINEVELFFKQLFKEGTNAHPDDNFCDYVNLETGAPTYTKDAAEFRNNLMAQSFDICEAAGLDIYDVIQEIYLKESGLDKFIPLPSSLNDN